jgi:hypothetical protein
VEDRAVFPTAHPNCFSRHGRCGGTWTGMPASSAGSGCGSIAFIRRVSACTSLVARRARHILRSHCWGYKSRYAPQPRPLSNRRRGIRMESLPKTLRGAVLFTHKLGHSILMGSIRFASCTTKTSGWHHEASTPLAYDTGTLL